MKNQNIRHKTWKIKTYDITRHDTKTGEYKTKKKKKKQNITQGPDSRVMPNTSVDSVQLRNQKLSQ